MTANKHEQNEVITSAAKKDVPKGLEKKGGEATPSTSVSIQKINQIPPFNNFRDALEAYKTTMEYRNLSCADQPEIT